METYTPTTIHLRPINPSDKRSLIMLFTDSHVRRYLGGPIDQESAISRAQKMVNEPSQSIVAIEANDQFVGLIEFSEHIEESGTEISYQLLPKFIGKGIAFIAIQLALESRLSARPVIAETQVSNLRSRKLLHRLGFKPMRLCERHGAEQIIMIKDY